ncbi:hypothetical protein AKH09_18850 [Vibrio parahaemolyticus]|nr:hypothetical protein AKH09_18850 [Vibrio parahaemolyticus]
MVVRLRKEEKFQILSEHLSEDMVNLIQKFTERLCKSHQQKLLRLLVVSIDLLKLPLNNNDAYALRQSYSNKTRKISRCRRYTLWKRRSAE